MAIGRRSHRSHAELDDTVRQLRSPADARAFIEGEVQTICQFFDPETSESDREATLNRSRWVLLGHLARVSSAWDEGLIEECLREGHGTYATWLAENPAISSELTRPILRWCRNKLLGGLRMKNVWSGGRFHSGWRADAFRALGALAARREISHDYWLLRLARTEARLLPFYYARREVLCAHPDSPPSEGWRAMRHAEHPNEEIAILRRILRVSRGDEYRRAWVALRNREIKAAADALEASSAEQVSSLSAEDLSLLLTADDQQVRLRAICAAGAARTAATTRVLSASVR